MRVDFYVLTSNEPQAGCLLACRLLEKAYHQGHRVFVYCENTAAAKNLDELLWTYKDDSFIPHNLQGDGPEPPPAIQIGYADPRGFNDILLNMTPSIPPFYMRFRRVLNIVLNDDKSKDVSRQHFREYRDKGADMHTHVI